MRMLKSNVWAVITILLLPVFFQSCGKDKDEVEIPLTVSPTSLQMLSEKGSNVSFTITTSSEWTISNIPSWLTVSATAGIGNATIVATSLSVNDSDENREVNLIVTSGSKSEQVFIVQIGAFAKNCMVNFTNILVMTESVAFEFEFDKNVSYFYAGYLSKSSAGWTDDRIVSELEANDKHDPYTTDMTGVQGMGGMNEDTEYYLCAVGYNDKGERGPLTKTKIKTLVYTNSSPFVNIRNIGVSTEKWTWDTVKDAYTYKYYMICFSGQYADYVYYWCTDAEIAWLMQEAIKQGEIDPIASDGSWNLSRTSDSNSLFIATWGVNIDNKFSPVLSYKYATLTRSGKEIEGKEKASTVKRHSIPKKDLDMILSSIRVIEM